MKVLPAQKTRGLISALSIAVSCTAAVTNANATVSTMATIPTGVIPIEAGSIEFYARLIGYSATEHLRSGSFGGGAYPVLIGAFDTAYTFGYAMYYTANDGSAGFGLGGHAGNGNQVASLDGTYGAILGAATVSDWHKYELKWSKDRLPGVDNGQATVAVYLDGVLSSRYFLRKSGDFPTGLDGPINVGFDGGQGFSDPGDIAIDELKIFDGDGNLVLHNPLESSKSGVISSTVGPNGSYVSGRFVPGVVGMAITTAVPEPQTVVMMLAGLGVLGFVARLRKRNEV